MSTTPARPAYALGHITVKDPVKWDEYRSQVPATLAPWNAELVFRGELAEVMAGDHTHRDTVLIRFSDLSTLQAWYRSPAYQSLIPLREQAADVVLLAYEG
jgi:uncharacterized protein (DUF1330 family)